MITSMKRHLGPLRPPPKIVSIRTALRPQTDERPSTVAKHTEYDIFCEAPESSRVSIVTDEIRTDMRSSIRYNDVLGKAMYIIQNAENAFHDENQRVRVILETLKIVAEYEQPEGVEVLLVALGKYGEAAQIKKQIVSALANICTEEHVPRFLEIIGSDQNLFIDDLRLLASRFPELAGSIIPDEGSI